MTTKINFSEARSELTQIVNHVAFGHDRYILMRNGKELVAIISLEDLDILELCEDYLDVILAKRVDKEIQKEGTVKWDQAKRDLGL